jgi:CRISPR-associated protein Cas5h
MFSSASQEPIFVYFERLPIEFDEVLLQYNYADFVFSNASFSKDMDISGIGDFYKLGKSEVIQLF